jgi:hypothetical protein
MPALEGRGRQGEDSDGERLAVGAIRPFDGHGILMVVLRSGGLQRIGGLMESRRGNFGACRLALRGAADAFLGRMGKQLAPGATG